MSLGAQLEKYRALAGLQYRELAELSDVDVGTINALEKRKSKRSEHAPALARALGLTVEQLLDTAADHSGTVLAHIAAWRSKRGSAGEAMRHQVNEAAASYRTGSRDWITQLTPDQMRAMLTPEDLQRIEAYVQAIVETRAADTRKAAA
jgi:transcriptional regulator with XRE-family HTH domain